MRRPLFRVVAERDDPGASAPDTDAHAAGTHPRRVDEGPDVERGVRFGRRAAWVALAGFFALGLLGALVGEGGAVDAAGLRRELGRLDSEVRRREAQVATLRTEVEALESDGLARERIAREELGLVRPNEIDFLLPRAETDAATLKPAGGLLYSGPGVPRSERPKP